jgi:hypothetical protein
LALSSWTRRSNQATERRHFAQLPEVLQGATFSGSLGMTRQSDAAKNRLKPKLPPHPKRDDRWFGAKFIPAPFRD